MIVIWLQQLCLYASHGSSKPTPRSGKRWQYTYKRISIDSTHILQIRTSTSGWNNFRDQMFEFDWQHMVLHYRTIVKILLPPIKSQQKQYSFNLKWHATDVCSEIFQSRLQQQFRKLKGIQRYSLLKSYIVSFQFTIRTPPQPKYMTRVRPAKGSLYL